MDLQRNFLIIAFLFLSFMIWQTWEQDKNLLFNQKIESSFSIKTNKNSNLNSDIIKKEKLFKIKTNVLELTINTYGGDVEKALLLNYPKESKSNEPFQLLETGSKFIYQAQSGLGGRDGPDNLYNNIRPLYSVKNNIFKLIDNQKKIIVPMTYKDSIGNVFIKTFTLKQDEYSIYVDYNIKNNSNNILEISIFGQLKQSIDLPPNRSKNHNFALSSFRGAAYSTSNIKYEKYDFDKISKNKNLNIVSKGGWIAMLQQYFATAWIPCIDTINNFYTMNLGNNIVSIGYKSQPIIIEPGKNVQLRSILWIGPEIQDKMSMIAPYLDLTVDYGWLWFISQPMFKLLKFIYTFLGNWGVSIIVITFIVRIIMYPLTKLQYTSMAKMRMLQPKIQTIINKFENDKKRISQEMIELYKKEKVNPLGGCFPLIIQMPIFLSIYYMLISSVELHYAPFTLWIHDLSSQDPYYILPILMGITMYFIQKMSPNTVVDPFQQKIINFMPIIFTIFFLLFPSGLVLYYIVSNLLTIIQQHLIYRGLEKNGLNNRKDAIKK